MNPATSALAVILVLSSCACNTQGRAPNHFAATQNASGYSSTSQSLNGAELADIEWAEFVCDELRKYPLARPGSLAAIASIWRAIACTKDPRLALRMSVLAEPGIFMESDTDEAFDAFQRIRASKSEVDWEFQSLCASALLLAGKELPSYYLDFDTKPGYYLVDGVMVYFPQLALPVGARTGGGSLWIRPAHEYGRLVADLLAQGELALDDRDWRCGMSFDEYLAKLEEGGGGQILHAGVIEWIEESSVPGHLITRFVGASDLIEIGRESSALRNAAD